MSEPPVSHDNFRNVKTQKEVASGGRSTQMLYSSKSRDKKCHVSKITELLSAKFT